MKTLIFFLLLLNSFSVYSQTTYIYREDDGTVWFGDQSAASRLGNVATIGVYGRPPAYQSCGKLSENTLDIKALNYQNDIQHAARQFLVDARLIKAVIKTESCFNHKAVSRVGAKGLMQLMPKTASSLGVKEIFNPRQNILAGTAYLRKLLDRFKQNIELALAAYNAGPTAVERYSGVPPYQETQKYIKKVLASYQRYLQYR